MTRVIADDVLRARLNNLSEDLEICDESGRVLGRFTPAPAPSPPLDPREPRVSEEELDRRQNSNERRYTTAEVIAYLESL